MAKILSLDDSPAFQIILKRIIELAGHEFVGVTGWAAVPRLVQFDKPDVFLIDINMPEMRGDRVAHVIRRFYSRLPVVLVSGEPMEVLASAARDVGAVAYVSKRDALDMEIPAAIAFALASTAAREAV